MAQTSIGFGIAMIVLGLGGYFGSGMVSMTALIPAVFGVVLVILGFVAKNESLRKHAMHGAALVGLLGISSAMRPIKALAAGADFSFPILMQLLMAGLSAVFLILCVQSFIAARRAR